MRLACKTKCCLEIYSAVPVYLAEEPWTSFLTCIVSLYPYLTLLRHCHHNEMFLKCTHFHVLDVHLLVYNYCNGVFTLAYSGTGAGDRNRDRKNGLYEIVQNVSHYTGTRT